MNKKVVTFTIAMVLLLGVTLGVTFALMTAQTKTLTNTFVVGNFGTLKLFETNQETQVVVEANDENVNNYNVIPGAEYTKDPYVTFTDNTSPADSYIFVTLSEGWSITLNDDEYVATYTINSKSGITFVIAAGWTLVPGEERVLYYNKVAPGASVPNAPIISNNTVNINNGLTAEDMKTVTANISLAFKAYAIQATADDTINELWTSAQSAV